MMHADETVAWSAPRSSSCTLKLHRESESISLAFCPFQISVQKTSSILVSKIIFESVDDLLENRIFPKQKCFAMLRCGYKTDSAVSESVVRTNIVTDSQDLLRIQIFEGKRKEVRRLLIFPLDYGGMVEGLGTQ